jgi:hypothetical protein
MHSVHQEYRSHLGTFRQAVSERSPPFVVLPDEDDHRLVRLSGRTRHGQGYEVVRRDTRSRGHGLARHAVAEVDES